MDADGLRRACTVSSVELARRSVILLEAGPQRGHGCEKRKSRKKTKESKKEKCGRGEENLGWILQLLICLALLNLSQ